EAVAEPQRNAFGNSRPVAGATEPETEELSGGDATEPKALVAEEASAAVPATLTKVRRDIFLPI
ncbi:MAG TPA: hypothetical protein VK475_11800, partial [Pyrinomonadaceae bacterium]|nr:hypothetical protein [Pyrinomonadaceae bacterium]